MRTRMNILSVMCVMFIALINSYGATEQVFFDDLESSTGWTRNPYGTDYATTGLWERDDPEGSYYGGTMQLNGTISGTRCLVTGRLAGYSPGDYDVDNGNTTVRSPAIQLPADGNLTLSFYYNFAHYSNASSADYFRVRIIGNTTAQILEVLGSPTVATGMWKYFTVNISSFKGQSIFVLVEACDGAEASLVEAAVEDVSVIKDGAGVWNTSGSNIYYDQGSVGIGMQPSGNVELEVNRRIKLVEPANPNRFLTLNPLAFQISDAYNSTLIDFNAQASALSISSPLGVSSITPNTISTQQVSAESVTANTIQATDITLDNAITAEQFKVGKWIIESPPDFVFAPDYNLRSLKSVKDFIDKNSHLPDVKSAKEITEQGIDLVEMNMTLLKKVEELFLYTIGQDAKIDKLEKELEELKK